METLTRMMKLVELGLGFEFGERVVEYASEEEGRKETDMEMDKTLSWMIANCVGLSTWISLF